MADTDRYPRRTFTPDHESDGLLEQLHAETGKEYSQLVCWACDRCSGTEGIRGDIHIFSLPEKCECPALSQRARNRVILSAAKDLGPEETPEKEGRFPSRDSSLRSE